MQPAMYGIIEVLNNITQYTVMGSRLALWLNAVKHTHNIKMLENFPPQSPITKTCFMHFFLKIASRVMHSTIL